MSQFYIGVTAGDIPPVVAEQYTTNNGIAVPAANNLNVFGQTSFTSPVMYTTGSGSTIQIENRAYIARYVVDSNTTIGVRGTYSDIQSAVNALQADGVSGVIYIRPGIYPGAVNVPNGLLVNFVGFNRASYAITGTFTFGTGCVVYFDSLYFLAASLGTSLILPDGINAYITNCRFSGADSSSIGISITGNSDNIKVENTFCDAKISVAGSAIYSGAQFYTCTLVNVLMSSSGTASFYQCTFSSIVLSGNPSFTIIGSVFYGDGATPVISGTTGAQCFLYDSVFFSTGAVGVGATGNFIMCGNTSPLTVAGGTNLFNTTPTILYVAKQSGNISQIANPSGNYNLTLGDTVLFMNTSAPRTVNMYSTPFAGLTYTIADATGSAGTNNITVNGNGSNIDNSSSYVIAVNWASITLIYTGTIWKVI